MGVDDGAEKPALPCEVLGAERFATLEGSLRALSGPLAVVDSSSGARGTWNGG